MIFYKLRKKSDPELYVKGTPVYLSYDKRGRIFQNLGQLRSFITSTMNSHGSRHNVSEWEVIELDTVELSAKEVVDIMDPKKLLKLLKS